MKLAARRTRMAGIIIIALMALSTALAACTPGGESNGDQGQQLVDTGQPGSPAGGGGTATPVRASSNRTGADAGATAGPSEVAGVRVSASQAEVGNLMLTLSLHQARRMVPEGTTDGGPTPGAQQGPAQSGPAQQEMVLGDQMVHVTKNPDAAQAPPPDPKDGQGDIVRHVDVQVKDKTTGQVVPYLTVTMDMLRDGRPVRASEQTLVPMVPVGGSPDQMHYGNNVAFPGKGRYQLFVRMPSNPMLGEGAPPYAQFDITIE